MASIGYFGCKQQQQSNDHPGFLEKAMIDLVHNPTDSSHYFSALDSAYQSIHDPGVADTRDKYYFSFDFFFAKQKNYEKALRYADSMLLLVDNEKNINTYSSQYVQSLFYKGDVLAKQKRFFECYSLYYKAKEILVKQNDSCNIIEFSHRLAETNYHQEKFLEAAKYYQQIIREIEGCKEITPLVAFEKIQGYLDNVGLSYLKSGMYDSAGLYFTKALDYIKQNEFRYQKENDFISVAKAVIYGNYAAVAIHQGNDSMAEYLLKASIKINEMPLHPEVDAAISRTKLAQLYLDKGRIKDAETVLQEIKPERYTQLNSLTEKFYLLQSELFEKKGDFKNAYYFLGKYQQLRDAVFKETEPTANADMQQTIENISRGYQIEVLEKNNQEKKIFLWLTVVIAGMAGMIILLIFTNYRRSKENVDTLVKLNDAIVQKNRELLQTLSALEQSHSHNNKLLKVVAHDLRGPLGAITSIAELSRDGHVAAEKYTEIMDIIFKSGTKALALANELLVDMKSVGTLTKIGLVDISEKIRYCIEIYDHRLKEKKQTIALDIKSVKVLADSEKIWRVFSNLISNSIKFSHVGDEIKISMKTTDRLLIIAFQDHGIGIPDELKDRIFEPTEATTRAGTFGEPSFGIGLSIAMHIVLQHGGQLWFESNAENGKTFYVSLPLPVETPTVDAKP